MAQPCGFQRGLSRKERRSTSTLYLPTGYIRKPLISEELGGYFLAVRNDKSLSARLVFTYGVFTDIDGYGASVQAGYSAYLVAISVLVLIRADRPVAGIG